MENTVVISVERFAELVIAEEKYLRLVKEMGKPGYLSDSIMRAIAGVEPKKETENAN